MDGTGIRILVVEDDEIDRLAFDRFVRSERLGYDYSHAGSVSEGKARLQSEQFDVVLLDYSLKDGTAFDLMADVPREIPTVIITGSGNEEIAVKAMKWGASDYLIKDPHSNWLKTVPITVQNVIKAKADELALRKAHAELERRVEERTAQLVTANRKLKTQIEQRKQAENALRASQERFRALTETTSEWIWEMNTEGVVTYASPRVTELLGYLPEEIVGKPRFRLMPPPESDRVASQFKFIVRSRKPFKNLESVNRHKSGNDILLSSSGTPFLGTNGEVLGYRGIDLDITERKKAENLLVQSERLKAIAELSSGVAHNFNNLLQIVITGLNLVLIQTETGDLRSARSTIERILESSRFGAETVRWLQEFAQSRKDGLMEQSAVFCLSRTVEQAIEVSKPWWKTGPEKEGIVIGLQSHLTPNCLINGKESAVFEVVVNLLKNASEALSRGGKIEVTTSTEGNKAILRVRDDGVGITKENLGKIFEPFFTTKGFSGTGMGLASTYGIVKRHGGEITVESEVGQGAQFTVTFPVAGEPLTVAPPEADSFPWRLRILLIDDEALIVKALKAGLEKFGQTVFTALSGQTGLEIFEREPVDLVISDLGMAVMNGWHVGRAVKEYCEKKGMRKPLFVLLTGWGQSAAHDERISSSGVDAVINKPITTSKLLNSIAELVRDKNRDISQ
ncbi:MAG: response regulator [Desulfomonilaceae bacterium]|nr:response regulator [Desulfomonilaceae bacterium]